MTDLNMELKPCPFCGCQNIECDIINIDCPRCFAAGPPRRAVGGDGVLTSDGQWNTRTDAELLRLQELVRVLGKALEGLYFRATQHEGFATPESNYRAIENARTALNQLNGGAK